MKKLQGLFIILVVGLILAGCGSESVTLTLKGETETSDIVKKYKINHEVELPFLDKEGYVFAGWMSEDDKVYSQKISIETDTALTPIFERYEDVFDMNFTDEEYGDNIVDIGGYSGVATYLKIPQLIDGYVVRRVGGLGFQESTVKVIEVPRDVVFTSYGFLNNESLEEVRFYGDYILNGVSNMSGTKYHELLTEHGDLCEVKSGTIDDLPITFSSTCPIKQVVGYDSLNINDYLYETFMVVWLVNYHQKDTYQSFMPDAFLNVTNLHTVQIPEDYEYIHTDAFRGCANLRNFNIGTNDNFMFEDGILYNADQTILYYYGAHDELHEYTLPDSINSIFNYAFSSNSKITKINIPNTYEDSIASLIELKDLVEIHVEEGNPEYTSIDGVLYKDSTLALYPASKTGTSFVVPNGVMTIQPFGFGYNQYLEEIDFNNVQHINTGAFFGSQSLSDLHFTDKVIFIGPNLFRDSNIQTVVWENPHNPHIFFYFGTTESNFVTLYVLDEYYNDYIEDEHNANYIDYIKPLSEKSN